MAGFVAILRILWIQSVFKRPGRSILQGLVSWHRTQIKLRLSLRMQIKRQTTEYPEKEEKKIIWLSTISLPLHLFHIFKCSKKKFNVFKPTDIKLGWITNCSVHWIKLMHFTHLSVNVMMVVNIIMLIFQPTQLLPGVHYIFVSALHCVLHCHLSINYLAITFSLEQYQN